MGWTSNLLDEAVFCLYISTCMNLKELKKAWSELKLLQWFCRVLFSTNNVILLVAENQQAKENSTPWITNGIQKSVVCQCDCNLKGSKIFWSMQKLFLIYTSGGCFKNSAYFSWLINNRDQLLLYYTQKQKKKKKKQTQSNELWIKFYCCTNTLGKRPNIGKP